MNGSPAFTAHSDVLDAVVPENDDKAKDRLFQELKSRGRGAVQASCWPDAVKLYTKALDCTSVSSELAILQSNIALCQGKMNRWNESSLAAEKAVALDATYVKGWWRLGQAHSALGLYDQAVNALGKAQALEPNNKALTKEYKAMQTKQQAAVAAALQKAEQDTLLKSTTTTTENDASKTTTTKMVVVGETKTDKKSSTTTTTAEPMQIDDDVAFSKSEPVKGYKIVNGKKTSYFHNELSQEAAALIGDIAPKKLETTTTTAAADESVETTTTDGSAWNKAGTWEERDVSAWALDTLKQSLMACSYTLPNSSPAPGAVVSTSKATVTGHASVATVRGKKRYIYECMIQLEWHFEDGAASIEAKGSLNFPDVDGTCATGEAYDAVGFVIQQCDEPTARPLLEQFVHKLGWRDAIHQTLDDWVRLFQETY